MASTIARIAHLQIPLEDVVKATNNFDGDNIIGHGGFGTAYKGVLLRSGKEMKIAARRLDRSHVGGDVEFLTEISMLSDLNHENIVCMVGFCDEGHEKIIITTYEPNGSLGQFLNSQNLTWTQRLRICVGVARAMSYLHSYDDEGRGYAIIHRYINSDTILLDENWEPKLSGFEISIKHSVHNKDKICLCEPVGAMGCMDPAIEKTGGVTCKSDVYSFGVVLFELLSGRKAFVENEASRFLVPLAKHHYENETLEDMIRPELWNEMSPQSLRRYSKAAYSCLNKERPHRPDSHTILDQLLKALEFQLPRQNLLEKSLEHLKMDLNDFKLATDNFSDRDYTGRDLFYAKYLVELDNFDKQNPSFVEAKNKGGLCGVVIKRVLPRDDELGERSFFTEIEVLTSVKHPNIVTLLGFCVEGPEMILAIEYDSNSYLALYLGKTLDNRILTWEKRLKICIDVAHALNYLHYEMEDGKIIINRNIKSDNIGLDENWKAKIVDFGISVFLPPNQEDEALYLDKILGTECYTDPEYEDTSKLKRESDVYGFGVVLFEILCGRLASDSVYTKEYEEGLACVARRSVKMGTIKDMIDPVIMHENSFILNIGPNKDSLDTFIKVAYHCVSKTQDKRPTMKLVIRCLERALLLQRKANPRISLEDIRQATHNFQEDNCIGGGGFGKVYKGSLQVGDRVKTIVAKRLDTRLGQGKQQFLSELQILLEYTHKNVISLVGYCDENDEKVIVYEYASRGSLDRYLNDASLTWMKRLNICIEVASALDFLHGGAGRQAKVIHRDIKTANILLNHDWKAKLADFGLSLISPLTHETDYVIDYACGTPGYLDPLYRKLGYLTIKSDIYSFGVVLFEILCGKSTFAIRQQEGRYLPDFIKSRFDEGKHDEVVFEQIRDQIVSESLTTFQNIAYQCLHQEREKRPTTQELLTQLKKALEFQVSSTKMLKED